jgi:hypothetical protein
MPDGHQMPKYGVGEPFKEMGFKSFKKKKMFSEPSFDDDEE